MSVTRSVFGDDGAQDAEHGGRFADRVNHITISAIKQMPILARRRGDCVSLGQGVPSLPTPSFIREELTALLRSDPMIGMYSLQPGLPELQWEVARYLEHAHGAKLGDPEREVMISCGAMEAIAAAVLSTVEPGDDVLLPAPTYASHIEQVLLAGGRPVFVPLQEDAGWRLDPDRMRSAVTSRTKAILLSNPSNPTGAVLGAAEIQAIAGIAIEHDLFIIADETYDFLVYDGGFASFTSIPEIWSRLLAGFTFSKMFCMTGFRVGFLTGAARSIGHALKVHDAVALCAPTISQRAALIALRETGLPGGRRGRGDEALTALLTEMKQRRSLASQRLRAFGDIFQFVDPAGAYYLFARYAFPEGSRQIALRILEEAGVITIPGAAFGPSTDRHLRLSFGADPHVLNEAFDRLERWVNAYSPSAEQPR